jgi:hypothetical protein
VDFLKPHFLMFLFIPYIKYKFLPSLENYHVCYVFPESQEEGGGLELSVKERRGQAGM